MSSILWCWSENVIRYIETLIRIPDYVLIGRLNPPSWIELGQQNKYILFTVKRNINDKLCIRITPITICKKISSQIKDFSFNYSGCYFIFTNKELETYLDLSK